MTASSYSIGVVGHRELGGEETRLYVQSCCHKILAALRKHHKHLNAISALAEGADSIFAQSAISLGIKLESVAPFAQPERDFADGLPSARYHSLRQRSVHEDTAGFSERSDLAYKKSMEWVVLRSDAVVAVWDGVEQGSIGGTWAAIALCRRLGKRVIQVDPIGKCMGVHHKNSWHGILSEREILRGLQ